MANKQSDTAYLQWLRTQPSCLDGQFGYTVNGEGRNESAHIRRSNNAGIGIKPQFSAVPLTKIQHQQQHSAGELQVLQAYRPDLAIETVSDAKAWFAKMAKRYYETWLALV